VFGGGSFDIMKMPMTYQAILKDDKVEWIGEAPDTHEGITVQITLIDQESRSEKETRGAAMAAALRKIADSGGFDSISDPVEWQREIRKDRPLPGRDE
jgi:hypothetical protein